MTSFAHLPSASIAPIVRLNYLVGLNDSSHLFENLGAILAWASAEMNVGMFVANLPACRPFLEQFITRFSSWSGSASRSQGGGKTLQAHSTSHSAAHGTSEQYLELGDRPGSSTLQSYLRNGHTANDVGVETRIYGDLDGSSSISLDRFGEGSQKNIVERSSDEGFRVNVHKDFKIEVSRGKSIPKTQKQRTLMTR